VISTDSNYTGAGTVTPPAVGLCSTVQVVRTAGSVAPWSATGLPVAGAVRLRGLTLTTGASTDATRPSAPFADRREPAVTGVPTEHTSSTPGDLPPEDPPS
jgi:hypothetical protein